MTHSDIFQFIPKYFQKIRKYNRTATRFTSFEELFSKQYYQIYYKKKHYIHHMRSLLYQTEFHTLKSYTLDCILDSNLHFQEKEINLSRFLVQWASWFFIYCIPIYFPTCHLCDWRYLFTDHYGLPWYSITSLFILSFQHFGIDMKDIGIPVRLRV